MRKSIWAALAVLPLAAVGEARADGCGGCLNLQGGFRVKICGAGYLKGCVEPFHYCNPCHGHGGGGHHGGPGYGGGGGHGPAQLAPWYLYWPMEAHYQVPAPTGYPYWPAAMTPPPTWGYTPPPAAHGGYQPAGQAGYQPAAYTGYQPSVQAGYQPAGNAGYQPASSFNAPNYWYGH